ncbi:unnamed protein product, partial [Rotaria sordida]
FADGSSNYTCAGCTYVSNVTGGVCPGSG